MPLSQDWEAPDHRRDKDDLMKAMARAHSGAMREWVDGHKSDQRDDVEAAGLGARLARTWRGNAYPGEGRDSLDPAGMVYVNPGKGKRGNAPTIIEFYDAARYIRPFMADALAIPTKNVPLTGASRGAKRRMTPVEVEARFNAELFTRRFKSGRLGLFINVIPGLSTLKGGYRPVTARRVAKGRKPQAVHMFTLTHIVKGRKRVNHRAIADRWARQFPRIVDAHAKLEGL